MIIIIINIIIIIFNLIARKETKTMKCKCEKCGYVWQARTSEPKACPKCKQYTWREKQEVKK